MHCSAGTAAVARRSQQTLYASRLAAGPRRSAAMRLRMGGVEEALAACGEDMPDELAAGDVCQECADKHDILGVCLCLD